MSGQVAHPALPLIQFGAVVLVAFWVLLFEPVPPASKMATATADVTATQVQVEADEVAFRR